MLNIILLCTRSDLNARKAILSFNKIKTKDGVQKFISIPQFVISKVSDALEDFDGELIIQPGKLKPPRENLKFLLSFSNAKYIMFCHDDDLFSPEIAINYLELINNYHPETICSQATYINEKDKPFPRRQHISKNNIKILDKYDVLFSYFLPFSRSLVYPTMVFRRVKLLKYFRNNRNLSHHEDVKLIYEFAENGKILMNLKSNLYFYRIHSKQDSCGSSFIGRLRLMVWLRRLKINKVIKLVFFNFSKIQYYLFYFKPKSSSARFNKLLIKCRRKLIHFRTGNRLFSKE